MKKISKILLGFSFLFTLVNMNESKAQATGLEYEKIKDVEVVLYTGATLLLTESNKLFASGVEYYGEFGDGGTTSDKYLEFTEIDISAIHSPIVDIVSSMGRTILLTEDGSVYVGGGHDTTEVGSYSKTFKRMNQSMFHNRPVKQIYRTLFHTTYVTDDGNLFFGTESQVTLNYIAIQINTPSNAGIKKIMEHQSSNSYYVLDNNGDVWFVRDLWRNDDNAILDAPWVKVETPEGVKIKDMSNIRTPYFLANDGRVLYSNSYYSLNSESFPYVESYEMSLTDITEVTEFVKFYAPGVHSELPNVRKTDGHIYVGSEIVSNLGVQVDGTNRHIAITKYLPHEMDVSLLTIGQPYTTLPYASGGYVAGGHYYSMNGSEDANNGVYHEASAIITPLTITPQLALGKFVYDPTPIQFAPTNVNPSSAILGQKAMSEDLVQINWQVRNAEGEVVSSGILPIGDVAEVILDINSIELVDGDYVLSYFRETTSGSTRSYMRSLSTEEASFTIAKSVISEPSAKLDSVETQKTAQMTSVPTGDKTSPVVWGALGLLSISLFAFMRLVGRKEEK